jgi:hypothetical protein
MDYCGKLVRMKTRESLNNHPLIQREDNFYDGWGDFLKYLTKEIKMDLFTGSNKYENYGNKSYGLYITKSTVGTMPSFAIEEVIQ